jgi:DNA-binding IscR family transcriptional regulator
MLIPKSVETSLRIIDVLKRCDVKYAPAIRILEHVDDTSKCMCDTMLYRLVKAGILDSKKGPTGGYRFAKETTLLELFLLNAPTCVLRQLSCNEEVNALQGRFLKQLNDVVIQP